jgi:DNA uptake protein ComE-like DNA-binding protein
MKRILSVLAVLAFVAALGSNIARAEDATATKAEPAKTTATAKPAAMHHRAAAAKMPALDLNSCSKEDLTKLGVSDADADKIIAGRPYAKKSDLMSKKIVDAKTYAKLRGHVIAKQVKAETTAK